MRKIVLAGGAAALGASHAFAVGALPTEFTALNDNIALVPAALVLIGVAFITAKSTVKVLGKLVSYIRG